MLCHSSSKLQAHCRSTPALSGTPRQLSAHAQRSKHAPAALPEAHRRELLGMGVVALTSAALLSPTPLPVQAAESVLEPMEALKDKDYGKPRRRYSDYVLTPSGLQYQDIREGTGEPIQEGDTAIVDWDGYTIGYYGRPFEARNKPKGSAFAGDKDYLRFKLGSHTMIPGFEEAVYGMKTGGFRRIVVPPELSYPEKGGWDVQGPKPNTFSGQRALGFVLTNKGMIDKTLLFDIELKRIDK